MASTAKPKSSKKDLVCALCFFECTTENAFTGHLNLKHPRDLFFWCRWCGILFSDRQKYVQHTIGGECLKKYQFNHPCGFDNCSFSTGNPTRLLSHFFRGHKGSSFIPCAYCKRSFTIPACLVEHIQLDCCERPPPGSYKRSESNQADSDHESSDASAQASVQVSSSQAKTSGSEPSQKISNLKSSGIDSSQKGILKTSSNVQAQTASSQKAQKPVTSHTKGNVSKGKEIVLSDSDPDDPEYVPTDESSLKSRLPATRTNSRNLKGSVKSLLSTQRQTTSPAPVQISPAPTKAPQAPKEKGKNDIFPTVVNKRIRNMFLFCEDCGSLNADERALKEHQKSCLKKYLFSHKCAFQNCNFATGDPIKFIAHFSLSHAGEQFIPCANCSRSFSIPSCLVEHIQTQCNLPSSTNAQKNQFPKVIIPSVLKDKNAGVVSSSSKSIGETSSTLAKNTESAPMFDSDSQDLSCDMYDDFVAESPPASPETTSAIGNITISEPFSLAGRNLRNSSARSDLFSPGPSATVVKEEPSERITADNTLPDPNIQIKKEVIDPSCTLSGNDMSILSDAGETITGDHLQSSPSVVPTHVLPTFGSVLDPTPQISNIRTPLSAATTQPMMSANFLSNCGGVLIYPFQAAGNNQTSGFISHTGEPITGDREQVPQQVQQMIVPTNLLTSLLNTTNTVTGNRGQAPQQQNVLQMVRQVPQQVPQIVQQAPQMVVPTNLLTGFVNTTNVSTSSVTNNPTSILPNSEETITADNIETRQTSEVLSRQINTSSPQNANSQHDTGSMNNWFAWSAKVSSYKAAHIMTKLLASDKIQHFFKCMAHECSFSSPDKHGFSVHLMKEHQGQVMNCCYCFVSYKDANYLVEHVIENHGKLNFQCSACLYRACSKEHVREHYKCLHAGQNVTIITCPSVVPSKLELCQDVVLHKTYNCSCNGCDFRTLVRLDFQKHWQEHHSSSSFYGCGYCNLETTNLNLLIEHYSAHNVYEFECDYCSFGSQKINNVVDHICINHANYRLQMLNRLPTNPRACESPQLTDKVSSTTNTFNSPTTSKQTPAVAHSATTLSSIVPSSQSNEAVPATTAKPVNKGIRPVHSNTYPVGINASPVPQNIMMENVIISSDLPQSIPMLAKVKEEPRDPDEELATEDFNTQPVVPPMSIIDSETTPAPPELTANDSPSKNTFDVSDLRNVLDSVQEQLIVSPAVAPAENTEQVSTESSKSVEKQVSSNVPVRQQKKVTDAVQSSKDLPVGKGPEMTGAPSNSSLPAEKPSCTDKNQPDIIPSQSATPSEKTSEGVLTSYRCIRCDQRLSRRDLAEEHARTVHGLKDLYKCPNCTFSCPDHLTLKKHAETYHPQHSISYISLAFKKKKLKKSIANDNLAIGTSEDFNFKDVQVKIEVPDQDEPVPALETPLEQLTSPKRVDMGQMHHSRKPRVVKFQCKLCTFFCRTDITTISRHLSDVHDTVAIYKCPNCDYKSLVEASVKKHSKAKHVGSENHEPVNEMFQKSYEDITTPPPPSALLDVCTAQALESNTLDTSSFPNTQSVPIKTSPKSQTFPSKSGAELMCVFCHYSTSEKSHMVTHLYMEMHYFKYLCIYCNFRGSFPMDVINHCKRIHPNEPEDVGTELNSKIESWVEDYISALTLKPDSEDLLLPCQLDIHYEENCCNVCQLKMTSKTQLQDHLYGHLQYRPHCCLNCDKTFVTLEEAQQHQKNEHASNSEGLRRKKIKILEDWVDSVIEQSRRFASKGALKDFEHTTESQCSEVLDDISKTGASEGIVRQPLTQPKQKRKVNDADTSIITKLNRVQTDDKNEKQAKSKTLGVVAVKDTTKEKRSGSPGSMCHPIKQKQQKGTASVSVSPSISKNLQTGEKMIQLGKTVKSSKTLAEHSPMEVDLKGSLSNTRGRSGSSDSASSRSRFSPAPEITQREILSQERKGRQRHRSGSSESVSSRSSDLRTKDKFDKMFQSIGISHTDKSYKENKKRRHPSESSDSTASTSTSRSQTLKVAKVSKKRKMFDEVAQAAEAFKVGIVDSDVETLEHLEGNYDDTAESREKKKASKKTARKTFTKNPLLQVDSDVETQEHLEGNYDNTAGSREMKNASKKTARKTFTKNPLLQSAASSSQKITSFFKTTARKSTTKPPLIKRTARKSLSHSFAIESGEHKTVVHAHSGNVNEQYTSRYGCSPVKLNLTSLYIMTKPPGSRENVRLSVFYLKESFKKDLRVTLVDCRKSIWTYV